MSCPAKCTTEGREFSSPSPELERLISQSSSFNPLISLSSERACSTHRFGPSACWAAFELGGKPAPNALNAITHDLKVRREDRREHNLAPMGLIVLSIRSCVLARASMIVGMKLAFDSFHRANFHSWRMEYLRNEWK